LKPMNKGGDQRLKYQRRETLRKNTKKGERKAIVGGSLKRRKEVPSEKGRAPCPMDEASGRNSQSRKGKQ